MEQLAYYSVLYYLPYPFRNEQVNVGIVVSLPSGDVRVHIADNLRKVLAVHPAANINEIRELVTSIPAFLEHMECSGECVFNALSKWGKVTCFPEPCMFSYAGEEDYERIVESILSSLVYPERKKSARIISDRLFSELKETFKAYQWLGADEEDIQKHMIVPRFPVAVDFGVKAEFALQNGKLHLIESVDFRSGTFSQKRQEAMSKMLVFDVAAQVRNETVNSYVVISGDNIKGMTPIISLLDRYAENLVRWDIPGDVESFLASIEGATGKKRMPLFPQPG
ncbi:DUF3037 domain-containing protein [Acidithiobacillus sp. M4-SHS-6]|uniref:DUF3037 domain-containing protein n=1 Tax=Acidithiobacillus sp. M4-SHS-6 TaxID=3383024 RepID=UPI0039BE0BE3